MLKLGRRDRLSAFSKHMKKPNLGKLRSRIMYVELKDTGLIGPARIGRVYFSRTGKTLYYSGKAFQSFKCGYKANFFDVESREEYWISGPRRDGLDRLNVSNLPVNIDDDVREEYWIDIRKQPESKRKKLLKPLS